MHFLEAHRIVHEFAGAVGRERKSLLLPFSSVKHNSQELCDAFVIFFGHMVMWNTRTQEEYDQYLILSKHIHYVIPDDTYDLIVDGKTILEKAENNTIYRFLNRKKLEMAKKVERVETDITLNAFEEYKKRIQTIDFGLLVKQFQDMMVAYYNEPQKTRKPFDFFMDDYIYYLYSNTSQRTPNKEDFSCFWPFDKMREWLVNFDNLAPVAQNVYSEYRAYIQNSK